MAIPRLNISCASTNLNSMPYTLWGNIYYPQNGVSFRTLFNTRNVSTGRCDVSTMGGLTVSFSTNPTGTMHWNQNNFNPQTVTVTANCAWTPVLTAENPSGSFTINNVTGTAQLGGNYVGGNGSFQPRHMANGNGSTGTITIYYSNGSGGISTQTILLAVP